MLFYVPDSWIFDASISCLFSITESGKVFGIGKAVCSWHQLW
jgi:hypothetical protein